MRSARLIDEATTNLHWLVHAKREKIEQQKIKNNYFAIGTNIKLRATGIEKRQSCRYCGQALHSLKNYLMVQWIASNTCNELSWTKSFSNGCWLNVREKENVDEKIIEKRRIVKCVLWVVEVVDWTQAWKVLEFDFGKLSNRLQWSFWCDLMGI